MKLEIDIASLRLIRTQKSLLNGRAINETINKASSCWTVTFVPKHLENYVAGAKTLTLVKAFCKLVSTFAV